MGVPRTLPAVTVGTLPPTPIFTGAVTAAASFSITNGIATIVLGSTLPVNGYNGPNGYPGTAGTPDIHGGITGGTAGNAGAAGGQQVTLWGFTTATYFNATTVTVLDCNPANNSFRFYFNHANVASTNDTGNTAVAPAGHYRAVRIEVPAANTGIVYIGDLNVSATRYIAALSPAAQLSVEIAGDNIPADRIFFTGTVSGDSIQRSLIY